MTMDGHTIKVQIPAFGSECDRVLTDEENRILHRLLRFNSVDPLGADHLLAQFATYMAGEILADNDDHPPQQYAFLGAHYALAMRRNAMLDEWPEDSTSPAIIYEFVESWLDSIDVDEARSRTTMAGLGIREYLRSDG